MDMFLVSLLFKVWANILETESHVTMVRQRADDVIKPTNIVNPSDVLALRRRRIFG